MKSAPQIFFSYAWGDEHEQGESRERIVSELYDALLRDHYRVVRDKNNLEYKGFISEFMGQIGHGECIVVAISKKYVKSAYCMFELYEIARNSNFDKHAFSKKVLPIVVEFVDFTDPAVIDEHFSFWENEYKEWDDLVRRRAGQLAVEQMQRYDKIRMIYQNFGKLTEWIVDMNTLKPQLLSADNFAEIKKAIIKKGTQNSGGNEIPIHETASAPVQEIQYGIWKRPIFWVFVITALSAILLVVSWLSRSRKDSTSQTMISAAFTAVRAAGEQLIIVQDRVTGKFGYARANDTTLLISCKYDEANPFNRGMALVKMNSKYQWIKPDSSAAFIGQFDFAKDFAKDEARVANGPDSFSINRKGARIPLVVSRPVTRPPQIPTDEPVHVKMCDAVCHTNGITGIEVSFTDPTDHIRYTQVSKGNELVFRVPCHLLDRHLRVDFRGNGKSDYRNVSVKEFEIPESVKNDH
jgi:hypothetical protein